MPGELATMGITVSYALSDRRSPPDAAMAVDKVAWDDYVSRHPAGTVDHLWAWRDVLEGAFGHRAAYIVARREETVVGVLPLVLVRSRLFGRSVVSVPFLNYGGVLADDAAAVRALVDAARDVAQRFGASHVELRNQERQDPALPVRSSKLAMTLPLPSSSEELWAALDRKVRNQIRKAQKSNLVVLTGGVELIDEFYGVFSQNMRDLGTPVYTKRFFTLTMSAFSEVARVFVVRHGSQSVAAGISIRFRGVTLNPWASSLRESRHLCSNMLLYWAMIEGAIADGASVFDFGRSSPGGGPHQFKLQWGAVERPLPWEYVLLSRSEPPNHGPSNPRFAHAIELWRKLPLWVANTAGPLIAKNLP